MSKTALITSVNGQDGSYLAELLIEKGYHIHGMVRRTSQFNRSRIEKTRDLARKKGLTFELHYGNMGDAGKARQCLGWSPRMSFETLVEQMMRADMALIEGDG